MKQRTSTARLSAASLAAKPGVERLCERCSRPLPAASVVCLDCGKSTVIGVADVEGLSGRAEDETELGDPRAIIITIQPNGKEPYQERTTLPVTAGRSRSASLVVDDPLVSRLHARLESVHGALIVTDQGSSNGTYLNATRIRKSVVTVGDELEIGNSVLELVGIEQ